MNSSLPQPSFTKIDRLAVEIHADRRAAAHAAARAVAAYLAEVIATRGEARVIFACAPSQDEFLAGLIDPVVTGAPLDWSRVVAFHMDEYIGLNAGHPQSFRWYLQQHLLQHVSIGAFHPLDGSAENLKRVCRQYWARLRERPIDVICLGIGENGHIAFNDPSAADFADPRLVKVVELDPACRQQQVNDGCFARLEDVPTHALSLTIPVFRSARRLSVQVPGERKAPAVRDALCGPVSDRFPASILRHHPRATLYLDPASAQLLKRCLAQK